MHLLDVPGFGDRRTSRFPSTVADVADVIAEWLTVTDLPRAVLVGHSTGAQAAVCAQRGPSRSGPRPSSSLDRRFRPLPGAGGHSSHGWCGRSPRVAR